TDQLLDRVYEFCIAIEWVFAEIRVVGCGEVFADSRRVGDELIVRRDRDVLAILRGQHQSGDLHVVLFLGLRLLQSVVCDGIISDEQRGGRTQYRAQQHDQSQLRPNTETKPS